MLLFTSVAMLLQKQRNRLQIRVRKDLRRFKTNKIEPNVIHLAHNVERRDNTEVDSKMISKTGIYFQLKPLD